MSKIYYTVLFSICISSLMSFSNGQSADPVTNIVDEIAKHNFYEKGMLGYTGMKSRQYDRFLKLCDLASDEELLKLTGHANVIVRVYAFQGLEKRGVTIPADVISRYKRDHTMVRMLNGDEATVTSVQKLTVGEPTFKATKTSIKGGPIEKEL